MKNNKKNVTLKNGENLKGGFHEFLLSEFSMIAQAHFKTISEISIFFKHYLMIMSIPIVFIGYFLSKGESLSIVVSIQNGGPFIQLILYAIAVIGLFVMCYIINLRMDAILYARTMNVIRGHYHRMSGLGNRQLDYLYVLPQSKELPSYHEKLYFWPVITSFALFNTLYFVLANLCTRIINLTNKNINLDCVSLLNGYAVLMAAAYFFIHFVIYWLYAQYREHRYLK